MQTGNLLDVPCDSTIRWDAWGLAGERVNFQANPNWTWDQLHLHVCSVLAERPWDHPAPVVLFTQTRAVGLTPGPQGQELIGELCQLRNPPYTLRLEIFPQRLGRGLGGVGADETTQHPEEDDSRQAIPDHVKPLASLPASSSYKVFTINVNTRTNFKYLQDVQAEVLCVQETRHTVHSAARLTAEFAKDSRLRLPGHPKPMYTTKRTRNPNPDIGEH